ncbi:MAG: hypothetical protein GY700_10480, partial [Propionibacteriaceae bacterium]|nr:hypothetical protein [Propionibacteriaceae bacterium]
TDPVETTDFFGTVDTLGDNSGLPSGAVTFATGETTKTVTIQVLADSTLEPDEALQVSLSNPGNGTEIGTATATGAVRNDDAELNITAGTASLSEGDAGHGTGVAYTYAVTRTGDTDQVTTVDWTVVHGTTDGNDFSNGSNASITPSGTLTFNEGVTEQIITVYAYGDTGVGSVEGDETFGVQLSNANAGSSVGTTGSYDSTLLNDDTRLTLSVDDYSMAEAKLGETTTYNYTVTRSGYTAGTSAYNWSVTTLAPWYGGTGTTDVDDYINGFSQDEDNAYTDDFPSGTYPSGSGTFAAGALTDIFTVAVNGDNTPEGDQWFATTITATSGYDEVYVTYDNPDAVAGTLLFQSEYQNDNYYDGGEYASSYTGVASNANYLYTEIQRDEAVFYLSDR